MIKNCPTPDCPGTISVVQACPYDHYRIRRRRCDVCKVTHHTIEVFLPPDYVGYNYSRVTLRKPYAPRIRPVGLLPGTPRKPTKKRPKPVPQPAPETVNPIPCYSCRFGFNNLHSCDIDQPNAYTRAAQQCSQYKERRALATATPTA